ncbi:unnamed protein product [Nesidiocoris tenuis]|uniref:Uncharacterized protein n=1 Tax=Nesidiocoris tenuis TaxID=355587 RepID=A0A6H5HPP1_9HEMI|nr:unnamed protein product [Nesidiocoris tenuis]
MKEKVNYRSPGEFWYKDDKRRKKRFEKSRNRSDENIADGSKKCPKRQLGNLRAASDAAVPRLAKRDSTILADSVSNTFLSVSKTNNSSSSADDFYDAEETIEAGDFTATQKSDEIRIHFTTDNDGSFSAIFDGGHDGKRFHIGRPDWEKYGVDMKILSASGGIISIVMACGEKLSYLMSNNECAGGGDSTNNAPEMVNCDAQTSVVLGANEITETEEMSFLSSVVKFKTESLMEPPLDSLTEVEIHDILQDTAGDISHFSGSATSSCSSINSRVHGTTVELGEESYTNSTPHYSSAFSSQAEKSAGGLQKSCTENWSDEQKLSAVQNLVNQLRIMLEDEILEGTDSSENSAAFAPLTKAKSDSILVLKSMNNSSHEEPESSANLSMVCVAHSPKSSEHSTNQMDSISEELETEEEAQYDSPATGVQSDTAHKICTKPSGEELEYPERPMTSAADAVTSMRQALKPISDQINVIKTKMIGMNIQPRTSQSKFVEEVLSQISLLERQFAPNSSKRMRILSTEPEDFTSQSSYDPRDGSEYFFQPSSSMRSLVIFPDKRVDGSCAQTSEMSLTRSSILSDPDELSSAQRNKQCMLLTIKPYTKKETSGARIDDTYVLVPLKNFIDKPSSPLDVNKDKNDFLVLHPPDESKKRRKRHFAGDAVKAVVKKLHKFNHTGYPRVRKRRRTNYVQQNLNQLSDHGPERKKRNDFINDPEQPIILLAAPKTKRKKSLKAHDLATEFDDANGIENLPKITMESDDLGSKMYHRQNVVSKHRKKNDPVNITMHISNLIPSSDVDNTRITNSGKLYKNGCLKFSIQLEKPPAGCADDNTCPCGMCLSRKASRSRLERDFSNSDLPDPQTLETWLSNGSINCGQLKKLKMERTRVNGSIGIVLKSRIGTKLQKKFFIYTFTQNHFLNKAPSSRLQSHTEIRAGAFQATIITWRRAYLPSKRCNVPQGKDILADIRPRH